MHSEIHGNYMLPNINNIRRTKYKSSLSKKISSYLFHHALDLWNNNHKNQMLVSAKPHTYMSKIKSFVK